jgi:hypothetical protein
MVASLRLPQWFNLEGWLTGLQEVPVAEQFVMMDFSPRFDKTLLRSRKIAANAFNGIESEHGLELLIRRMEVRSVVRCADLREHPNNDPEESRNLWHRSI